MSAIKVGEYSIGCISLFVVFYRIFAVMIPMAKEAITEEDYSKLFLSFTLLV